MSDKEKLLACGVRNLKEFGYPHVTNENILTDYIYRKFFDSMLADHEPRTTAEIKAVAELRAAIATATEAP